MSRWFRFYDDVINDPKVVKLSDSAFRGWVGMLCVASKHKGVLPASDDLAFFLRIKQSQVAVLLAQLVSCGLLDKRDDGVYVPHNWEGRQYLSDGSADRVKRHREKRAASGLVSQWTAPAALRKAVYDADNFECVYCGSTEFLSLDHKTSELNGGTNDFDNLVTACRTCNGAKRDMTFDEYVTKTNIVTLHGRYRNAPRVQNRAEDKTEQKATRVPALDDGWPSDFREQFWDLYPHKIGKADAIAKLERTRKRGVSWVSLMDGLRRYIASKPVDRPWCNPATWLNQARWEDQPAGAVQATSADDGDKFWDGVLTSFKRFGVWSKHAGPELDSPGCRVPADMLAKHGLARSQGHAIEAPRLKSIGSLN